MTTRRSILSRLTAPLRGALAELGLQVLCLGLIVGTIALTGLGEGDPWRTALFLFPLVLLVVGVVVIGSRVSR